MTRAHAQTRTRRVGIIVASVTMLAATAGLSGSAAAGPFVRDLPGDSPAPVEGQLFLVASHDALTRVLERHADIFGTAENPNGGLLFGNGVVRPAS